MSPSLPTDIALTLVAGLMSGNCMLPMKLTKAWKWGSFQGVFSPCGEQMSKEVDT